MNIISLLHAEDDNPLKYLLLVSLLYTICLIFPQEIGWDILLALSFAILFVFRPLWGVFFIICIHPIMSCTIEIFWTAGHPIENISPQDAPYGGFFLSPLTKPLTIYPFQIASLLVLPSLIYHCRPFSADHTTSYFQKVIYTALSFFFIYGVVVSSQANYADKSLFYLSRFASITILILYLTHFVKRIEILRQIMALQSCTALILALLAYYGTYYGFETISYIWRDYGLDIIQHQSLFNGANTFNPETMGMLPGFGISAKHQFSTYLVAGIFSAAYLQVTVKNKALYLFYFVTLLMLYMTLFYGPSKLSLVGIFLGVLLGTMFSPYLRRHIAVIIILLVSLNIFSLIASIPVRPMHAKLTEGSAQSFKVVNNDSEFSMSLKGRLRIMREAAKRIFQTNGVGIGSGMLSRDPLFPYIHGHNFFITLLAECGVPAVISIMILGTLLVLRVIPIINLQNCLQDSSSLAVLTLTATFLAVFFEYIFDTFVWTPQLWITGGLLWISANLAEKK